MTEDFDNFPDFEDFPDSQQSMEVEEIGDSLMNLEIETTNRSLQLIKNTNQEHQIEEPSQSTLTEESRHQADTQEVDFTGSLVGFTAATLDEVYEQYRMHAFVTGFSIRQSTTRYTQGEKREIRGKDFVCSKEGFRCIPKVKQTPPAANDKKKRTRQVHLTRTGCKAFIRVKRNNEGLFEVEQHVMVHNHELTRHVWQHLHRSERKITQEKAQVIDQMADSGLKTAQAFRLLSDEAGGQENVGHTMTDHYNYISRRKMKEIQGGDAQTVIDSLYKRQSEDEDFFFRFKLGGGENENK